MLNLIYISKLLRLNNGTVCSIGTCIFNNNLCGWTNALDDDGEWQLNQGDTPSYETGPHHDSDGNGTYVCHSFLLRDREAYIQYLLSCKRESVTVTHGTGLGYFTNLPRLF